MLGYNFDRLGKGIVTPVVINILVGVWSWSGPAYIQTNMGAVQGSHILRRHY